MAQPHIFDLTASADLSCYSPGRQGLQPVFLVCHNTCGPADSNSNTSQARALSDAAARYLLNNNREVSAHYLVGAESIGAPIYSLVKESDTAYQCGGNPPDYPSTWQDPATLMTYHGYDLNLRSIGIEVFGQASDTLGPNQLASLKWLVQDIASRYPIIKNDPSRIVAHANLEGDRTDGKNWVNQARQWVQEMTAQPQQSQPDKVITLNNYQLGHGFLDFWMNNGGLKVFGLPLSNEFKNPDTGFTTQVFERYVLEYHPENPADWQVLGLQAGKFWLDANKSKLPQ